MISRKREQKIILSGVNAGMFLERQAILSYLKSRMADLHECQKNDTCNDLWHFANGLVEDITEGEHNGSI